MVGCLWLSSIVSLPPGQQGVHQWHAYRRLEQRFVAPGTIEPPLLLLALHLLFQPRKRKLNAKMGADFCTLGKRIAILAWSDPSWQLTPLMKLSH
jgi:hypothetical protein